ncbi:MAG: hypothetical protein JWL77_2500 [Chthonomonadaceae bacterium]|nr:hypothetical protein [Chthonomonadaceae bacterium]
MEQQEYGCQQTENPTTYRWVGQESGSDCGVAALAMVSGRPYAQVRSFFPFIETTGITYEECACYLRLFGFTLAPQWEGVAHKRGRELWPPAPFASVHLCVVKIRAEHRARHWVVMLADGTVLDGHGPQPRQLSDYFHIHGVIGSTPGISAQAVLMRSDALDIQQGTGRSGRICALTASRSYLRLRSPEYLIGRRRDAGQFATEQFRRWLNVNPSRLQP